MSKYDVIEDREWELAEKRMNVIGQNGNNGDHYETLKPSHYEATNNNDVYQFAQDNGLDGMQTNVIKYVTRYKDKNGIEDLKKARETINRMISYNLTNGVKNK